MAVHEFGPGSVARFPERFGQSKSLEMNVAGLHPMLDWVYYPGEFLTTIGTDKAISQRVFMRSQFGALVSFIPLMEPSWAEVVERINGLPAAAAADGLPAPTKQELQTALAFVPLVAQEGVSCPLVGPANDGGVAFEWELDRGRSVYCYARAAKVEVGAFDSEREYVDLAVPAFAAARIVCTLLSLDQWL